MKKTTLALLFSAISLLSFAQSAFTEKTFNDLMAPVRNSALQVLLVLTLILGFYTEGVAQCTCTNCRCSDSLELVKLYNATNGANWTNKWILTSLMTTWYGVTLADGRVTTVALINNHLSGTLLDLNFSKLQSLNLLGNTSLIGPIPNFNFPELQYLNLGSNQLSGTIPNFNLTKLQTLNLRFNKLSSTIPNFTLPNLQYLDISFNPLSGTIPNFILPNLKTLSIGYNQLSGTIPNFNLSNLETLYIGSNQLSGTIPDFNLPNLGTLNISSNPLTGAIPNFNLPNLKSLEIGDVQVSGTIPNFNLPKLEHLVIGETQVSGTIPNFNLPKLQYLQISFNPVSGTIPNFNLPNLLQLHLYVTQLSGQIPNFNLPKLKNLYLMDNQLSGCIPKEIKTNCPFIGAMGGDVSNNRNLATQNWTNYWNNGEGACLMNAVASVVSPNDWRIYPNPAHDVLNIEGLTGMSKVTIYNVAGGLVFNTQVKDNAIDVSQLSRGIYTIRIISGQNNAAHLFLKE